MLGFVSLLMDVSSEMIHSLLPMFLVSALGASAFAVGLIEGAAEATALIVKVFSGALSDWLGRRKGLALLGYGLGAVSKPLFALAGGVGWVIAARLIDRVGKGIRGAPRDALVADIAPPEVRGAAFGLRQSLDTVGAFAGPLLAVGLMLLWANDFRAVFWVAVLPAAASVMLLWWGVKEPAARPGVKRVNPISRAALRQLGREFWWVVVVGGLFTLARFSEAFLVLRAQQSGMPLALVPLVLVAMNLVYASSAYPFGRLSDWLRVQAGGTSQGVDKPVVAVTDARAAQNSHQRLLMLGLLLLIAADCVLAASPRWPVVLAGVAIWGLHLGLTQGLLATMVADTAPPALRGTAYGMFNLVSGVALLLASVLAGLLWDRLGAASTFWAGALICVLTLLVLLARRAAR